MGSHYLAVEHANRRENSLKKIKLNTHNLSMLVNVSRGTDKLYLMFKEKQMTRSERIIKELLENPRMVWNEKIVMPIDKKKVRKHAK